MLELNASPKPCPTTTSPKVSLNRQPLRDETLQMALWKSCPQPPMLQTTILRNKKSPMRPNDTNRRPLQPALHLLLENPKRRPARNKMGRNSATSMGWPRNHSNRMHQTTKKTHQRIQRKPTHKPKQIPRSATTKTRRHQPRRRTHALPSTKRTNHLLHQTRLHHLPRNKRNKPRSTNSTQQRTNTTLHLTMLTKRNNIQKNLPPPNTRRMAKTKPNTLHTVHLQMPHSTTLDISPPRQPKKPKTIRQTHRQSEPHLHRTQSLHVLRLLTPPLRLRKHANPPRNTTIRHTTRKTHRLQHPTRSTRKQSNPTKPIETPD